MLDLNLQLGKGKINKNLDKEGVTSMKWSKITDCKLILKGILTRRMFNQVIKNEHALFRDSWYENHIPIYWNHNRKWIYCLWVQKLKWVPFNNTIQFKTTSKFLQIAKQN